MSESTQFFSLIVALNNTLRGNPLEFVFIDYFELQPLQVFCSLGSIKQDRGLTSTAQKNPRGCVGRV